MRKRSSNSDSRQSLFRGTKSFPYRGGGRDALERPNGSKAKSQAAGNTHTSANSEGSIQVKKGCAEREKEVTKGRKCRMQSKNTQQPPSRKKPQRPAEHEMTREGGGIQQSDSKRRTAGLNREGSASAHGSVDGEGTAAGSWSGRTQKKPDETKEGSSPWLRTETH